MQISYTFATQLLEESLFSLVGANEFRLTEHLKQNQIVVSYICSIKVY